MSRRRGGVAGLAALLAILFAAATAGAVAGQPPRESPPPYAETVEVVESSVVVELPANRPDATAEELLVLEGGISREVTRLEPLGGEDPWELLVWIDTTLCRSESLASTLLGLARHSTTLARLGRVRVVLAGETPREVLAPSREPLAIELALAAVAGDERACGDRASELLWEARAAADPAAAEAVLARLAELVASRGRLLAQAAGPCPHDACAVLLVAHGYPLELDLSLPEPLRSPGVLAFGTGLAEANRALARRLALARWALVALPFQPPPPPGADQDALPREARPGPDAIPPRKHLPSGYGRNDDDEPGALLKRVWPRGRARRERTDALPPRAWDIFLLPEMAPLRALADGTGGMLLRVPDQLAPALAELAQRTRIWYRTTPLAPGEVRELVVLVGSPPRRALAPAWVGLTAEAEAPD